MQTPAGTAVDPRATVSPTAQLGPGCTVCAGAVLGAGAVLEAQVFVGPNAVFVEPQAGLSAEAAAHACAGVYIGANATLWPGIVLAAKAVVRPGAVVKRSVPAAAIVEGNPATIVGYVDAQQGGQALAQFAGSGQPAVEATPVRGVTVHHFPVIPDLRGNLTVGEFDRQVPFRPLRYFMVFGVPSREIRGEHAHYRCHQFLVCVRGSCAVVADDGHSRVEVPLDAPHKGLYLPPLTWGIQYKYSADALLLVFASEYYDPADYIRDHAAFLQAVAAADADPIRRSAR
jgi:carbonic anhydrase/acetyltransferase-like protein (isoleucine patch superfamily)/dTDP-4-dehydrorhamnose 3,5-epimerase-like enzyme